MPTHEERPRKPPVGIRGILRVAGGKRPHLALQSGHALIESHHGPDAEVSQERHEARREQRRISHLEGEHGGGVRRAQLPHQPLCEGTQLLHGLLPALKRLHLRGRIGPEVEEHAAELLAESVRAASHEGCGGRHVEELPVEAACTAASVVHEDARHERGRAHDEAEVGGNGGRQNGKLRL